MQTHPANPKTVGVESGCANHYRWKTIYFPYWNPKLETTYCHLCLEKGNIPIILHRPHPEKELPEYQIKDIKGLLEEEGLI